LLWAGGFTGSEGHSYRESLRDASEAMQLAAAMRAGCLVVYSGARNGHTQNHARRLFVSAIRELLPLADELNVTLAVEPMHFGCAAEWTFLTSLDESVALMDTIASPHFKLAFDTYHFGGDPKVLDCIRQVGGDRIAIVHLGDSKKPPDQDQDRNLLGEGNLPLGEIIAALGAAGYDGYYDIELMGEEIEASNYKDLLQASKQAYQQLVHA
jgi:sugar phosphate isomerase/epimerase